MRPELEISQQMDAYLNNLLTEEEKVRFENKLREDPVFSEEFELHKLVNEVVMGASEQILRDQISKDLIRLKHIKILKIIALVTVSVFLTGILILVLQRFNEKENSTLKRSQNTGIKEKKPEITTGKQFIDSTEKNIGLRKKEKTDGKTGMDNPSITDTTAGKIVLHSFPKPAAPEMTEKVTEYAPFQRKDPCADFSLKINPKTTATCANSEDGVIDLTGDSAISGGTAPYLLSLNGGHTYLKSNVLYGLASGDHVLIIKDGEGCVSEHTVSITEKICKVNKFALNPDVGETWKIPCREGSDFTVYIYSRANDLVYKTSSSCANSPEWNGNRTSGGTAEAGLYIYVIDYEDGTKENGQISVIR